MIYRLDPRSPLIWRGPTSIQIGLNRHPLVLDHTTPTTERLIGALVAGASAAALQSIAARTGQANETVTELLERVRPHLSEPGTAPAHRADYLDGTTEDVRDLTGSLRGRRLSAVLAGSSPDGAGVLCADYVLPPERISAWMSAGVPHCTIEFDDNGARISSAIVPGHTACARCRQLWLSDADEHWPALASQLSGRRVESVTTPHRVAALILALTRVEVALRSPHPTGTGDVRITRDGETRESGPVRVHPRCGCQTLQ
ncbi:MAG: hypothetical protein ACTJHU_11500 [Mycetocola sp.]